MGNTKVGIMSGGGHEVLFWKATARDVDPSPVQRAIRTLTAKIIEAAPMTAQANPLAQRARSGNKAAVVSVMAVTLSSRNIQTIWRPSGVTPDDAARFKT